MALVVRADFHWLLDRRVKVKSLSPRFCEAVRDGPAFQPPLADKRLAAGFHLGGSVGIDHIAVIFAQLVMHVFGSMTQKVAVLVHGAALNGKVIAQSADRAASSPGAPSTMTNPGRFSPRASRSSRNWRPRRLAFSAHIPDRKQDLLAIPAHPYSRENRDVGGLAIQSGLDHSAVKDQPNDILIREATAAPGVPIDLHLAPRPAHNVLAHSTRKSPNSARFTRRVLVPDRYTKAISASAFLVSRW